MRALTQSNCLPQVTITVEVGIGSIEVGFAIAVKLTVSLGDLDREVAQGLVDKAHMVCPYSKMLLAVILR